MKNKLILSIIALLCLLGSSRYAAGQRGNSVKQTWEYTVSLMDNNQQQQAKQLNQLGADGWELVAVVPSNNLVVVYLKRAK